MIHYVKINIDKFCINMLFYSFFLSLNLMKKILVNIIAKQL